MKLVAQLTLALWLAAGLTTWSVWCARIWVTRELAPTANLTTRLCFWCGRAMLWGAPITGAMLLMSGVAFVTFRALGG